MLDSYRGTLLLNCVRNAYDTLRKYKPTTKQWKKYGLQDQLYCAEGLALEGLADTNPGPQARAAYSMVEDLCNTRPFQLAMFEEVIERLEALGHDDSAPCEVFSWVATDRHYRLQLLPDGRPHFVEMKKRKF